MAPEYPTERAGGRRRLGVSTREYPGEYCRTSRLRLWAESMAPMDSRGSLTWPACGLQGWEEVLFDAGGTAAPTSSALWLDIAAPLAATACAAAKRAMRELLITRIRHGRQRCKPGTHHANNGTCREQIRALQSANRSARAAKCLRWCSGDARNDRKHMVAAHGGGRDQDGPQGRRVEGVGVLFHFSCRCAQHALAHARAHT